jgi:hypothetical protein
MRRIAYVFVFKSILSVTSKGMSEHEPVLLHAAGSFLNVLATSQHGVSAPGLP